MVALFGTLIAGLFSLLLQLLDPRTCTESPLETAVYICFGVHCSTFFVLLMSYICTKCFVTLGKLMGLFYFLLVAAMVCVQIIYFHGESCSRVAPLLYYWLFVNIMLFYILVAYGLSLWGAYICWEVDEEEKVINEALKRAMIKNMGNAEYDERVRSAGWIPLED